MVIRTWHKGPCLVFSVGARLSLLTTMFIISYLISFNNCIIDVGSGIVLQATVN